MHKRLLSISIFLVAGCAATGKADTPVDRRVNSGDQLARIVSQLHPGDVVTLADGTYQDQNIVFTGAGTDSQPIALRAETPGKVIFTGDSTITIDGQNLVVSGLCMKNGGASEDKPTDGIAVKGAHNRLTDCAVIGGTYKFLVHLYGQDIRMDHCYLAEKTSQEPTLQIEAPGDPNDDRIDHNHFGHRPPLGKNGGETMRVGYSWQSMNSSRTLVEDNLFSRCDGEIEIISSKSCDNTYRYNTFLDCAGMLTLRHGNRCVVDSNFFIAHHKRGSGGIRVIGENHTIINNYFDGIDKGAFWVTSGWEKPILKSYFAAKNCLIAFNTVVDSAGPCVDLDAGLGGNGRTVLPQNITIANNLFSPSAGGEVLAGKEGDGYLLLGNLAATGSRNAEHAGIDGADPKLVKASDGLWRPADDSPVHHAAQGGYPVVLADIDGQPRVARYDVGCDQLSDAPITNRPLQAADVGPSWLSPGER